MEKKKFIAASIMVVALFAGVGYLSKKSNATNAEEKNQPKVIPVSLRTASESRVLNQTVSYVGTITGDQEANITAKSSGTITSLNFNLGDFVGQGKLLAKIDDTGNTQNFNEGFKSSQIQQAQLAVQQAKESYDLAKKNYKDASSSDRNSLKTALDIAKIQYENAKISAAATVDSHLITSSISGKVTKKAVSIGDSVNTGQLIATISKTNNIKIVFFVDQEILPNLQKGMPIEITNNSKLSIAKIANISPSAEESTKRFRVEALPEEKGEFNIGTIVDVKINILQKAENNNLLLPLSAITTGQNESYIFIKSGEKAKKIPVSVIKVSGENAQVNAEVSDQTEIIIDGSKLVSDGENISIK